MERKKKLWIAAAVLTVALALGLWRSIGAPVMALISDPASFRAWVEDKGWYSRLIFLGMVVFQVLVAVIPGEPFEIAAGYAFGALEGTLLCIGATALGSIITFWLVRRFGMRLVRKFFTQEQINSVKFLKTNQKRVFLFLLIYMLPGTPKDLLGYFAGLTDIPFPVFCLICTLGRIPSVVTSTVGGNALGTRSYGSAALIFALTLAVSGGGLWIYDWVCKKHKGGSHER